MNEMPIAHAMQWAAQLAIYNGHSVIYNRRQLDRVEEREREAILNG